MDKVAILGAGAWGSAIANIVAKNGVKAVLYSNDEKSTQEINEKHTNTGFVSGDMEKKVSATTDLKDAVKGADCVFIILPSKVVSLVLKDLQVLKSKFKQKFVIFTKGIDSTERFFSDLVEEYFPEGDIAVLSGPNFATEVFEHRLTVTTVATKNKAFFDELKTVLNCDYFNIKYFDDLIAVQLCGLVKNVLAILCGISEGLELGRNTFAAIVTKGVDEIHTLCLNYNCNEKVINTPAGIGDLILTCSSLKSRNMSFGFKIGCGENIKTIIEDSATTIEGLANAKTLSVLSKRFGIKHSVAEMILDIVNNNYSRNELKNIIMNNLFAE